MTDVDRGTRALIFAGAFAVALLVLQTSAIAAADSEPPDVPGDDIFGFTSATDVGKPGDTGFANENDGRLGKRDGSYFALNTKYEFSRTFAPDWWIAGSLFAARNYARNVTDIPNIDKVAFDGVSFEIAHRIVSRSATYPFAITLSVEPRWGLIDGSTGLRSDSIGAEFKFFVDAIVVPDKIFWAANLTWAPQSAQDPFDRTTWLESSSALVSTAVAFQLTPQFFVGAEARYLMAFDTALPQHKIGEALYLGPTLLWKVTDAVAFNTTYQPQIAGRSIATPWSHLDLDNFERAQFRFKASIALQ
jgi:hypothetical protein